MQADSNSSIIKHSGGKTPCVLNLSTKWMKVVSFTAMSLHLRCFNTHQIRGWLKFGRGLDNGPQSLHRLRYPDYVKEEKKSNIRILLNVDKTPLQFPSLITETIHTTASSDYRIRSTVDLSEVYAVVQKIGLLLVFINPLPNQPLLSF